MVAEIRSAAETSRDRNPAGGSLRARGRELDRRTVVNLTFKRWMRNHGVAKYVKDKKDAIREVIYQSGIRVKPSYSPRDLEEVGFDYAQDSASRANTVHAQPASAGISQPSLDDPSVHRVRHAGGDQPTLQADDFPRSDRLNVAFDLPTQMGYDSDDPLVLGEVGRVGMAVDSLRILKPPSRTFL